VVARKKCLKWGGYGVSEDVKKCGVHVQQNSEIFGKMQICVFFSRAGTRALNKSSRNLVRTDGMKTLKPIRFLDTHQS